ncbi:hypothetical protein BgiBS90_017199 [Biomphalaria glabrata]|nr:hypothetical protein BgiBS90_017196 [Biomphalaria glabrata]KAI8781803.1 hypothetical protein BgiBS90_017199 [Biomphalaria glabrata]
MIRNKMRSMMWNKVDESVLPVEGQIDQSDNIVSQAKGGINSFGKEHLPGQDCGCTNSGDGGAGNWSAVCNFVVGKSVGGDFQGEKRDDDCFDDLNALAVAVVRMVRPGTEHTALPPWTKTFSWNACFFSSREIVFVLKAGVLKDF